MKITKERLQQLIKEEMADLEQEGWGDKSWHYGEPRSKKKSTYGDIPPERKFQSGMAELFQSLVRPIYTEGKAVIPDDASISRNVEAFAKQHSSFADQFMKAAEFHVENIRSIVQKDFAGPNAKFKELPDVVEAFEQAADKFLRKMQEVSGGVSPPVPPVNESKKIKISFRKN